MHTRLYESTNCTNGSLAYIYRANRICERKTANIQHADGPARGYHRECDYLSPLHAADAGIANNQYWATITLRTSSIFP